jgi:hypothetical protein
MLSASVEARGYTPSQFTPLAIYFAAVRGDIFTWQLCL